MSLGGFHQINITSRLVQSHSSGGIAGGSYPAAALLRRISLLRDQRRWGVDLVRQRPIVGRSVHRPEEAKSRSSQNAIKHAVSAHKIAMIENESEDESKRFTRRLSRTSVRAISLKINS